MKLLIPFAHMFYSLTVCANAMVLSWVYATPCGGAASCALGLWWWTETKAQVDVECNIYLLDLGMVLEDSQILALKALQE